MQLLRGVRKRASLLVGRRDAVVSALFGQKHTPNQKMPQQAHVPSAAFRLGEVVKWRLEGATKPPTKPPAERGWPGVLVRCVGACAFAAHMGYSDAAEGRWRGTL